MNIRTTFSFLSVLLPLSAVTILGVLSHRGLFSEGANYLYHGLVTGQIGGWGTFNLDNLLAFSPGTQRFFGVGLPQFLAITLSHLESISHNGILFAYSGTIFLLPLLSALLTLSISKDSEEFRAVYLFTWLGFVLPGSLFITTESLVLQCLIWPLFAALRHGAENRTDRFLLSLPLIFLATFTHDTVIFAMSFCLLSWLVTHLRRLSHWRVLILTGLMIVSIGFNVVASFKKYQAQKLAGVNDTAGYFNNLLSVVESPVSFSIFFALLVGLLTILPMTPLNSLIKTKQQHISLGLIGLAAIVFCFISPLNVPQAIQDRIWVFAGSMAGMLLLILRWPRNSQDFYPNLIIAARYLTLAYCILLIRHTLLWSDHVNAIKQATNQTTGITRFVDSPLSSTASGHYCCQRTSVLSLLLQGKTVKGIISRDRGLDKEITDLNSIEDFAPLYMPALKNSLYFVIEN